MDTWSMDMVMRGGSDLTWHIFRFQDGLKMRNGMNIPRKIGQMRIWWRHYPVGFQLTLINDATARVPCMHSVFYFIFNIFPRLYCPRGLIDHDYISGHPKFDVGFYRNNFYFFFDNDFVDITPCTSILHQKFT